MDPIPDTVYPEGSVIGNFDGNGNPYEAQELLHRPHAFALMHGDGGAKVAYGELHWRVDVFTLQFRDLTVAVAAHPSWDHTHYDHSAHTHEHDHSHTTRPHTHDFAHTHEYDHQHVISEDTHDGHSGYSSEDTHDHGGNTDAPDTPDTTSQDTSTTGATVTESGSAQSPNESTTGNESSTLSHNPVTRPILSHTVTTTPSTVTYCDQASQEAISQITQTVPKVDAEDGEAMDPTIPSIYHQLSSYGDVYLCWEVDLEKGTDVTNCWVQVGAPTNADIGPIGLGNATTDRLDEDPLDDAGTEGAYSIKIGTVNENDQIIQNVSSDVSWATTVMDRVKV